MEDFLGRSRCGSWSLLLLLLRWCSAHDQTGRVEFLVEASKAFLSSWFGLVHGVLRVAGNGPIETTDTAVIGERMVSFSVRQGTVDFTAARGGAFEDFHRNLSALCDLQETSLLELFLGGSSQYRLRLSPTVCLDLGPSAGKGIATSGSLENSWILVETVGFAD